MEAKIDEVIQECLELLEKGGSLDDCLAQYPDEADELAPLLQTAVESRRHFAIEMDDATRARLRGRVMGEWERKQAKQGNIAGIFSLFPRMASVAAALVVLVAVVALGGAGTVAASSGSVPGEALYPVKELRETAGLWFARSPEAKVEMYTRLVKERAEEVQELVAKEQASSSAISQALERLDENLAGLNAVMDFEVQRQRTEATGPNPKFLEALQEAADGQQSVQAILNETLPKAPNQAQPGVGEALEAIKQAQESVRAAVKAANTADPGDSR
jgi:hypothetical protein